ncbi:hypothetical protein L6164_023847 [Bauhinia variegata]|uniref:Uncharacterized protein n=1 Tax=Bauhinia variegata TaxID=167791 RepID=A0ACB9ML29_BAUVA|nr:hypothetical protein L6164_023847 [Bauhinia variegata]
MTNGNFVFLLTSFFLFFPLHLLPSCKHRTNVKVVTLKNSSNSKVAQMGRSFSKGGKKSSNNQKIPMAQCHLQILCSSSCRNSSHSICTGVNFRAIEVLQTIKESIVGEVNSMGEIGSSVRHGYSSIWRKQKMYHKDKNQREYFAFSSL